MKGNNLPKMYLRGLPTILPINALMRVLDYHYPGEISIMVVFFVATITAMPMIKWFWREI